MTGQPLTRRRAATWLGGYALVWVAALLLAPLIGPEEVPLGDAFDRGTVAAQILWEQRVPRVLLGLIAGGGLAMAGAALQALLRNPLASPYTLGIASGGSLGAVVGITVVTMAGAATGAGASTFTSLLPAGVGPSLVVAAGSLLGSFLVLALLYRLASRAGGFNVVTLLLAGVTLGIIASSGILLMRYLISPEHLVVMDRWLMGGLSIVGYRRLAVLLPLYLPGVAILLSSMQGYNLLAFGPDLAAGQGVNVPGLQRSTFLATSLVIASVVAVTGPIAFVGLIVPHLLRRISGADHRVLVPACWFAGGAFLTACDALAQGLARPTMLPVGIVTALLGGPFFLVLLLTRRRELPV